MERQYGYTNLIHDTEKLCDLLMFLCPNTCPLDMSFINDNIKTGLRLRSEIRGINVFADLEAIYVEKGREFTDLLILRLRKSYSFFLYNFFRNYNRGTLKKAKREIFLYDNKDLKYLVYQAYGILRNAIADIKKFQNHYLINIAKKTEPKPEPQTIKIKPALISDAVQPVFDILKNFFANDQQAELKYVLETGNNSSKKLKFKGAGNRLTDTYKKLIEHDFIPGCQKQDLINWIISNFTYIQRNKVKIFIYDTVEKTISRNDCPCKNPLITIENGQIQKVEQPRIKKY